MKKVSLILGLVLVGFTGGCPDQIDRSVSNDPLLLCEDAVATYTIGYFWTTGDCVVSETGGTADLQVFAGGDVASAAWGEGQISGDVFPGECGIQVDMTHATGAEDSHFTFDLLPTYADGGEGSGALEVTDANGGRVCAREFDVRWFSVVR